MKRKSLIWDSFFFGLIVALGMLFMLNRTTDQSTSRSHTVASEVSASKSVPVSNEPQEIVKPSIATGHLPTAPHVEVGRETLCLFTILFIDDIVRFEKAPANIPIPLAEFFVTLFRTAISPNAP